MKINFTKKIIAFSFFLVFIFALTLPVLAADENNNENLKHYKFQIPIGKLKEMNINGNSIGIYISEIYKYLIGIVGILATVVIMIGGVIWMTAGGNASRIGEAKAWIGGALMGLVLALSSYTILNTIDPDLVSLKNINVTPIDEIGCCFENGKAEYSSQKKCSGIWHSKQRPNYDHTKCIDKDGIDVGPGTNTSNITAP